jgi:tetratricopeptide (TPR) repeat protein
VTLLGTSAVTAMFLACGGEEPEPKVAKPTPSVSSSVVASATATTPPPPKEPTRDERMAKAKAAFDAKDYGTARGELMAVVAKKPDDAEAQEMLGDVSSAEGNLAGATDAYLAATKANEGKNETLALKAANALRESRRWDDLQSVAQMSLKANDKSLPLWMNLAIAQNAKQDYAGAVDTLGKMTQAFPDEPELWARLASAQAAAGHKDEAKKTAKAALDKWSEVRKAKKETKLGAGPQELAMISRAYRHAGDANGAIAALGKYNVPKDETASELDIERGFAMRQKKDLKGAEAQAKKAMTAAGDGYAPAHLLMAAIAVDKKKPDEARKHLDDYKSRSMNDWTYAFDAREIEASIK